MFAKVPEPVDPVIQSRLRERPAVLYTGLNGPVYLLPPVYAIFVVRMKEYRNAIIAGFCGKTQLKYEKC